MKEVAIMQPYIFPYLGYFQLISSVDVFVFYDDVNFIKRGWINRNRILVNGKEFLFTIPCKGVSQNKQIRETKVSEDQIWIEKTEKTIRLAYAKAPYFDSVFPLIHTVLYSDSTTIAQLAIESVKACIDYLELDTPLKISSEDYSGTQAEERADRLISITRKTGHEGYINPTGGKELYDKEYFASKGVRLQFLQAGLDPYPQQNSTTFIPGLSIIDLLMNVSPEEIREDHLPNYSLI